MLKHSIRNRAATMLLLTVTLVVASGAQCNRRDVGSYASMGPRVLSANPTLVDVMKVVNDNSAKLTSLFTTDATLSVPGAPSLRANLAVERQQRMRLRAETALTGPEVDLGSNDDLFWFWIRRNPPPTLYFCRHAQYASSAAKQMVPVDPAWLLDAVGLSSFDPNLQHSAPERTTNGRLQIRTTLAGPNGPMSKVTVVDEARGWVLEQHLYDERGTLTASALTGRYWLDPTSGAAVPQEIEIRWPATQFELKFNIRTWTVNSIPADRNQLFAMPNVPGWSVVDLADPNLKFGTSPTQNSQFLPSRSGAPISPPSSAMLDPSIMAAVPSRTSAVPGTTVRGPTTPSSTVPNSTASVMGPIAPPGGSVPTTAAAPSGMAPINPTVPQRY